jgi:hypothetical protein
VKVSVSITVTVDRADGSSTQIHEYVTSQHGDNPRFESTEIQQELNGALQRVTDHLREQQ